MGLAAYGKHPSKGDFMAHGVPAGLQAPLEGWLDHVLAELRDGLGAEWAQVWRDAPLLRFWVGEGVWGQPVAGVMATSQDRVGRRFPLILFCAGAEAAALPAPTVGGDGGWYDRVAALMADRLGTTRIAGPSDLVAGGEMPEATEGAPEPGPQAFWAVRPGADVAGLLADVATTDHRRAAAGRSYWWVAGDAPVTASEAAPPAPVADPEPPVAEPAEIVPAAEEPSVPADPWAADLPEDEGSPFASTGGLSLFAPPEAANPAAVAALVQEAAPMAPAVPRLLCSQVWAGPGLPTGAVLAWLLRGVAET